MPTVNCRWTQRSLNTWSDTCIWNTRIPSLLTEANEQNTAKCHIPERLEGSSTHDLNTVIILFKT